MTGKLNHVRFRQNTHYLFIPPLLFAPHLTEEEEEKVGSAAAPRCAAETTSDIGERVLDYEGRVPIAF
jgi:hypothetical protein